MRLLRLLMTGAATLREGRDSLLAVEHGELRGTVTIVMVRERTHFPDEPNLREIICLLS